MNENENEEAAVATIAAWLRLFISPEQVTELRALNVANAKKKHPHTEAGFYDGGHLDDMARRGLTLTRYAAGVYFIPNPLNPDLLSRRANRFDVADSGLLAHDENVIHRNWLLVDFDPARISGVSSTDEEKKRAMFVADATATALRDAGWPEPVCADSGNGYHLFYRIDLPNDAPSRELCRQALRGLAAKYGTEHVSIDTAVFNAARIVKLYGTMSRKGDSTPERPHRPSMIVRQPEQVIPVTPEQLTAAAAWAPGESGPAAGGGAPVVRDTMMGAPPGGDPIERASKYLETVEPAVSGEHGHDATFRAACKLVKGFGLTPDQAMPLFLAWNQRCQPPWDEHELRRKLDEAAKQPGPNGTLLASGTKGKKKAGDEPAREPLDEVDFCEMFDKLNICVLGEYENGWIDVYSLSRKKLVTIKDLDRFSYTKALAGFGPEAMRHLSDSKEPAPGRTGMADLKNAISYEGGKRRLDQRNMCGRGVWPMPGGGVLIVNQGEAASWRDGKLERIESPFLGGKVLDMSAPEPWCDFAILEGLLQKASDQGFRRAAIDQLVALLGKWNWKHEDTPLLATGLVLATWLQSCWEWRPLLALLGPTDAGKSYLLTMLLRLFGKLCQKFEKPSEAAVRQIVKHHGFVLLLDEMERDKHRQQLFELLRTSSSGGVVIRGTTDQRGIQFGLRHIVWLSSTESGLKRAPDKNRFITLDVAIPCTGTRGKIILPNAAELGELGMRLLASSVSCTDEALRNAAWMKGESYPGVPGRVVESFSVPLGVLAATYGYAHDEIKAIASSMFACRDFAEQRVQDETTLLEAILSSTIALDGGRRASVSQLIGRSLDPGAKQALERCGVAIIRHHVGDHILRKYLFLVPAVVCRELLRMTEWESINIPELLARIDDDVECFGARVGGTTHRGVAIPLSVLEELFETEVAEVGSEVDQRNIPNLFEDKGVGSTII